MDGLREVHTHSPDSTLHSDGTLFLWRNTYYTHTGNFSPGCRVEAEERGEEEKGTKEGKRRAITAPVRPKVFPPTSSSSEPPNWGRNGSHHLPPTSGSGIPRALSHLLLLNGPVRYVCFFPLSLRRSQISLLALPARLKCEWNRIVV